MKELFKVSLVAEDRGAFSFRNQLHVLIFEHKIVAPELKDPICHSNECQIESFSSEATKYFQDTPKTCDFHL